MPVRGATVDPPALRAALERLPRVPLAHLPTPLEAAPRLARAAGLASLYVKRDDLTGLALGGNKTRQLEFLLGEARAAGATAIVTGGGVESNHCRQLAAACAKLGLRACLILRGKLPARAEGNALLDALLGAETRPIPAERFYAEFAAAAAAWSSELRARGERPHLIDTLGWDSPSLGVAALGYVRAAFELEEQFATERWRPDVVYVCSGAATQAGLLVAKHALGLAYEIVGISASPFIPDKDQVIARVAGRALRSLGIEASITPADVTNLADQIGPGYGLATPASAEALRLAARLEGLLLDPTYTAKAMAGLLDRARRGIIPEGRAVLFIHTGGAPNLFLERNAEAITA